VPLPEPEHRGKHLLEPALMVPDRALDVDGLAASLAGGGAADALERP
jgi:amidophosphoribosyltransferase